MLENAVYSVISPENCANIIFKDAGKAQQVAPFMRLTAEDLLDLGLIDAIVPEPEGGAQENADQAAENLRRALNWWLSTLQPLKPDQLVEQRYEKFRKMGNFFQ
jgi:acetyl-CoA carboxylase carboxyl transferase subunit alpha